MTTRCMTTRCLSSLGLISLALCAPTVARAHLTASPPPMSLSQAESRAMNGAVKWVKAQNLRVRRTGTPRCTQLSPVSWKCMETVYCNAAATVPYAELTMHLWNTSLAPNGAYWSHDHLLASYKVVC